MYFKAFLGKGCATITKTVVVRGLRQIWFDHHSAFWHRVNQSRGLRPQHLTRVEDLQSTTPICVNQDHHHGLCPKKVWKATPFSGFQHTSITSQPGPFQRQNSLIIFSAFPKRSTVGDPKLASSSAGKRSFLALLGSALSCWFFAESWCPQGW